MKNYFNSDGETKCLHPQVERVYWSGGMSLTGDKTMVSYLMVIMKNGDRHEFADVEGIQNAITEANKTLNDKY